MSWLHPILIVLAAFLAVFAEVVLDTPRRLFGAQVDLLPGLMVYTSLNSGLTLVTVVAVIAGLLFDSLSANPLGASVLPLFIIGFVIQQYRGLILQKQTYAQFVLGLAASAAAPVMTWLILINCGRTPLIGWYSLWQWFVMSLLGGVATPIWFRLFGWSLDALTYQPLTETSFRADREIKRGRN